MYQLNDKRNGRPSYENVFALIDKEPYLILMLALRQKGASIMEMATFIYAYVMNIEFK